MAGSDSALSRDRYSAKGYRSNLCVRLDSSGQPLQ